MFSKSAALLPLLILGLYGCGGHDGGGGSAPNPFHGDYSGAYVAEFLGDNGTFSPVVSPSGKFSGSAHSNVLNVTGPLSGAINEAGEVDAALDFPGHPRATFHGTLVKEPDGSLHGTLTESVGGQSGDVDIQVYVL